MELAVDHPIDRLRFNITQILKHWPRGRLVGRPAMGFWQFPYYLILI